MALGLVELARRLGAALPGTANPELKRMVPPLAAGPGDLSFIPHARYRNALAVCAADAVIVDRDAAVLCRRPIPVVVDDVLVACAAAARWIPASSRLLEARTRRIKAYEAIDPAATIAASATIGRAVTVGAHTRIAPGCAIGDGVRIGSYCDIGANVTIDGAACIGNRTRIGANTTIGGDAFTFVRDGRRWSKLPDFGSVEIGDDVSIGGNVTVDRGAVGHTRIGDGAKIDSQVHVGHGTVIGANVAIAAGTAIAGEASIGDGCIIGGAVGINEGVFVAADCRITAMSMVTKSLREPGASYSSGWPVERSTTWWRRVARLTGRSRRTV